MTRLKSATPTQRVILLVDDKPDYLDSTRRLIESEGHTVLVAHSGPEALALLQERHAQVQSGEGEDVELLLLDYYMPGMTGEEVVTRLREFTPFVQVALATGYAGKQPPRELLRRLDIQRY